MSIGSSAALRALIASRRAMDVIGHNLANQNTPGYSRQLALLATTAPVQGNHLLRFGTGVEVAAVRSSVNEALLARIRSELALAGRSQAQNDMFDQVETLFADLSENGLATKLQGFFDGATEAATSPEDPVLRQNLLASASDLALSFRLRSSGLKELRTKSLLDAQGVVAEANQLLQQVAGLNSKIKTEEAPGVTSNDLRDQRAQAVEELAVLIGAQSTVIGDGTVTVSVNGVALVAGGAANGVKVTLDNQGDMKVTTVSGKLGLKPNGGRLGGIIHMVDQDLKNRLVELDRMAKNLVLATNRVHAKGVPASGPFTSLSSSFAIDLSQVTDLQNTALENSGLPFAIKDGQLSIAVSNLASGDVERFTIDVDAESMSVGGFIAALDAVPHLSAFLDGAGKLQIKAATGFGFDFSARLDGQPVEGNTFGASNAVVAGESTYPLALTAGSTFTLTANGGAAQTVTFNTTDFVDINNATADEVAAAINAQATGVIASVVDQKLVIQSTATGPSSSIQITDGTGSPAAALQLALSATGTSTPVTVSVTGSSAGAAGQNYTFKAVGDGQIGVTTGLGVEVYDANGALLTTLNVGEGYEPGTSLEVVEGVSVSFSAGTISGSAQQFFGLEVPGETDTSDVLAAFGLNAFFTGDDSGTIAINSVLEGKPELLSGSAGGGPGDGENFLALAAVGDKPLDELDDVSLAGFYNLYAADLGATAAGTKASLDSSTLVMLTLEQQRANVSGVNPDEELLDLERMQQLYDASVKFIQVLRELDDTLLQL